MTSETPDCHKEKSGSRSNYLTPCRRVGLRKKSIVKSVSGTPLTSRLDCGDQTPPCILAGKENTPENITCVMSVQSCEDTGYESKTGLLSETPIRPGRYTSPILHQTIPASPDLQPFLGFDESDMTSKISVTSGDISGYSLGNSNNVNNVENVDKEIENVHLIIRNKQELIADLRSKTSNVMQHNLDELLSLTCKWRQGCQEALNELLNAYNVQGQNCTMSSLLHGLGIPFHLVHYSEEDGDFEE